MGLNSGIALVGSTRFEGVRGARWTFTASGTVTNLVSRLADIAKAGEILVGPETARRLGEHYQMQRLGWEQLKNIATPIEIYCLCGPLPSPNLVLSQHRVPQMSSEGNAGGYTPSGPVTS